jgi:hypothetical protein
MTTRDPIGRWANGTIPIYRCRWCALTNEDLPAIERHERLMHRADLNALEAEQKVAAATAEFASAPPAAREGEQS